MLFELKNQPPLSLYVHIPWCVRKCPYCDFNSHEVKNALPEEEYVAALISDLEQSLPRIWGRRVQSIFIGGGTPSLFSGQAIDRLLSQIRARVLLAPDAEITMEANPGTAEQGKFEAFRSAGVTRLSIGVQSFNPAHLHALGRIHNEQEALKAAQMAKAAGFNNFNIDIMFGLPEQGFASALHDVEQAIELQPAHISYYQLTLEPNTLFYKQPPPLPGDDEVACMQEEGQRLLAQHGYHQYEVSAYAQTGRQSRHNRNYWEFGDYLGIGAGAHGKLTDVNAQSITRSVKQRHPREYLAKAATVDVIASEEKLVREDLVLEFMLNALRLRDGFDSALFAERTGLPITQIEPRLQEAQQKGLLEWSLHRIKPTELGYRYLNDVLALFLAH
jgi:oxygen-independent coproporphyrinogen-3 oxidase